ncbi:conserved hypothetical protein [Leishmania major strain Friedlin]|uniref:4a-hydroxytetrahydrobiopterin dehydratase n=1 Tax=Leishmania major TaxID=5664 RepID=Q4QHJ1_LEIMA|nr:conserved hypothetical protein [Leishmania major strain Friedlin]CAG9570001.1 Pterin_4_alpha_carbinolamine_dehydratase_-_putative [Leishmania major strain Friedlin]CAJ02452.1 conserved hypothetical protein [Leishmania major strain Friedlin]|eukprot:XP_001681357.1 conserved hypothetical protein [Leishmania major strain Friedlin]
MRQRSSFSAVSSAAMFKNTLTTQRAQKGDYGFNVFHNSNPQHGGSYARHERRMREDEVEDFLKSVKHWRPLHEDVADGDLVDDAQSSSSTSAPAAGPPMPRLARMGEEAIMRTFQFETFREAYLFMGRVWAFCYGSDKYPHVTWEGTALTVYLYSSSFRGLSKREARVAAFLNDQYNMLRKSKWQQRRIVDGIVRQSAVEELLGEEVAAHLAHRETLRTAPLQEVQDGPRSWRSAIGSPLRSPNSGSDGAGSSMGVRES